MPDPTQNAAETSSVPASTPATPAPQQGEGMSAEEQAFSNVLSTPVMKPLVPTNNPPPPPQPPQQNPLQLGGVLGTAALGALKGATAEHNKPTPITPPSADEQTFASLLAQKPVRDVPPANDWNHMEVSPALAAANKGIESGVLKSFGLTAPDPNHPESLGLADAATQTWDNIKKAAGAAYERMGGATEEPTGTPVEQAIGRAKSVGAAALTIPAMMASGIDGLATSVQEGVTDFYHAAKAGNNAAMAESFGRILGSIGQIAAGAEVPEAGENAGAFASKAVEYEPRNIKGFETDINQVGGAPRPANVLQGDINRSMGAAPKDVRFGDPSKALVEEGISWPANKGRLLQVNAKLQDLGGQLKAAVDAAPGTFDVLNELQPIVDKYRESVRLSNATPSLKTSMLKDLDALYDTAIAHAPNGMATVSEMNDIKQSIGDSVNWTKRPAGMELSDTAISAYKEAYDAFRNKVNSTLSPQDADLNRRVSNLLSAKSALKEATTQARAGTGPMAGMGVIKRAEAAIGHVATPAIVGAQKATAGAADAGRLGGEAAVATGAGATTAGQEPRVHFRASDGSEHTIPTSQLGVAQARDPHLQIIQSE